MTRSVSAQTIDIFDLGDDEDVELPRRDQYDRPLLCPPKGTERQWYTRMSTLSGYMTDDFGLSIWQRRLLAQGMSVREDLCALTSALPPLNDARCDKNYLSREQKAQDVATKKLLDSYIEQALESAGRGFKANWGTAIHGHVESGSSEYAPERMKPDVESVFAEFDRRGIEVICTETFVVNEGLRAAGRFDCLLRVPGWGIVVGDYKTGQVRGKGLQFAVQLSGYADSEAYDLHTDERIPLESLTGGERVNRNAGIVAHVPLGGARTELHRLDLAVGRRAAAIAVQVRAAREYKAYMTPLIEEAT